MTNFAYYKKQNGMIDISNSESIIRALLTDRLLIDYKIMIQINGGNRSKGI